MDEGETLSGWKFVFFWRWNLWEAKGMRTLHVLGYSFVLDADLFRGDEKKFSHCHLQQTPRVEVQTLWLGVRQLKFCQSPRHFGHS